MQETRQQILEILRERPEATVEDLVTALDARMGSITPVTVRHHLDILRTDPLIESRAHHRPGIAGRPQYMYALTEKALEYFPNNYQRLAASLLTQIKASLPAPQVNVIIEGVADQMVSDAPIANLPMDERLDQVVIYLNEQGYNASWQMSEQGYILHTANCPYQKVVTDHEELCIMDMRLIAGLTGVVPRRLGRIQDNHESCMYLLPFKSPVPL